MGARVAAARPRLRPSADGRCWWQAVAAVPERLSARGVTGAPAAPRAPTDPLPRLSGRVVPARGAPRLRLARAARVAGEAPPRGVPRTRSTVARAAPVIPRVPRVVVAAAAGVGASVALGAGVRPPMRAAEVAVAVRGSSIRARPRVSTGSLAQDSSGNGQMQITRRAQVECPKQLIVTKAVEGTPPLGTLFTIHVRCSHPIATDAYAEASQTTVDEDLFFEFVGTGGRTGRLRHHPNVQRATERQLQRHGTRHRRCDERRLLVLWHFARMSAQ